MEAPGALGVLKVGVAGPAGDLGIGGNWAGIRCISDAGGRGQFGAEAGGAVEQAQSAAAQASTASRGAGKRSMELLLKLICLGPGREQIRGEGVAAGLGIPQTFQLRGLVACGLPGVVAFNQRDLPVLDDDGSAGPNGYADNHSKAQGSGQHARQAERALHCAAPMQRRYSSALRRARPAGC